MLGGESDLGKSAVMRAVRAAVNNQKGQGFIREGTAGTEVRLERDGTAVTWLKGKSARYLVTTDGGEQADFQKVLGVPQQVADALLLSAITCGDVEIAPNFHTQFDHPFLVSETASTRAKVLGELSGITLLYLATAEARRQEAQAKKEAAFRIAERDKQQQQQSAFDGLAEDAVRLDSVDSLLGHADDAAMAVEAVAEVIEGIHLLAREVLAQNARLIVITTCLGDLDRLLATVPDLTELRDLIASLHRVHADIEQLLTIRTSLDLALDETDRELAQVAYCPTCGQLLEQGVAA